MRALLDETVPTVGGHLAYVVVGVVLIEEGPAIVKEALEHVVKGRRRSFHWSDEGPEARRRMVECLAQLGACSHVVVHYPTARRGQERARGAALQELLPRLGDEGATDLLIESRGPDLDGRDRRIIAEVGEVLGLELTYAWGTKMNPALWLPDAVCGAVGNWLDGSDRVWYEALLHRGVLVEPRYISGA